MPKKPKPKTRAEEFEDCLADLLEEFSDVPADDAISTLETHLMALRESAGGDE